MKWETLISREDIRLLLVQENGTHSRTQGEIETFLEDIMGKQREERLDDIIDAAFQLLTESRKGAKG